MPGKDTLRTTETLIERPNGRQPSTVSALQAAIALSKTEFQELTQATRTVVQRRLDIAHRFSEQDPKSIDRVQREILRVCPFIKRYRDYWPVKSYIAIYLSGCMCDPKVNARRKAEILRLAGGSQIEPSESKHSRLSRNEMPQVPSTPCRPRRQFIGQMPRGRRFPSGSPMSNSRMIFKLGWMS
ncbi:hypothetical protein BKA93DRAFT_615961 [Sparassis latifolia]